MFSICFALIFIRLLWLLTVVHSLFGSWEKSELKLFSVEFQIFCRCVNFCTNPVLSFTSQTLMNVTQSQKHVKVKWNASTIMAAIYAFLVLSHYSLIHPIKSHLAWTTLTLNPTLAPVVMRHRGTAVSVRKHNVNEQVERVSNADI